MENNKIVTADISDFGSIERQKIIYLLTLLDNEGLPEGFEDSGIILTFYKDSGVVALANRDFQEIRETGGSLEMYHYLPSSGKSGFIDELVNNFYGYNEVDQKYIEQYVDFIPFFRLYGWEIIREGEEYFVLDQDDEIVSTVYDINSNRDETGYKTWAEAAEIIGYQKIN